MTGNSEVISRRPQFLDCRLFAKCTGRMGRCVAFSLSNFSIQKLG